MSNAEFLLPLSPMRQRLCAAYRMDEPQALQELIPQATLSNEQNSNIKQIAEKLIVDLRKRRIGQAGLDNFLLEYDLTSEEGAALMCLAEALLRVPDNPTIEKLIADKIVGFNWVDHVGQSDSTFVNAATWGLLLTGKIVSKPHNNTKDFLSIIHKLISRAGEPIVRQAVLSAIKILGQQFVIGQTIEEALDNSKTLEAKGYTYSYDMLGEEACTMQDADAYFASYMHAISVMHTNTNGRANILRPSISIKLSALYPRYEWRKHKLIMQDLLPKVLDLAVAAKEANLGFTIDAEEAERLDLSLDIFTKLIADKRLANWSGLGLAVQAYQKRSTVVVDYVIDLARQNKRRISLRLVKGAYWDTEIKLAQERGLSGYPVFTRKAATDVAYIACVKKILAATDAIYPQFATHNAYTVALILELAQGYRDYEFQCLHGMGEDLYNIILQSYNMPCRIYAPVGSHEHLLGYLVRRLLENGANTSFVNRVIDANTPIDALCANPIDLIQTNNLTPHPRIPLPYNLYGETRPNSRGIDLTNPLEYQPLLQKLQNISADLHAANVQINNKMDVQHAVTSAAQVQNAWGRLNVEQRIACIHKMANLLDQHRAELIGLLVCEAKKTITDALAEVREAIDFCWYYAHRAKIDCAVQTLPGPTGEANSIQLHARGVVACISPWNFPLAIFLGQIVAALVVGNTVVAKPAMQTPKIALKAIELLHTAGIPKEVVQIVIGTSQEVGEALINNLAISGVMFTGSIETATHINQTLAKLPGALRFLVAETGGQNVMFVDSTALPEQVTRDVIASAFGSAGQRCSSLRVLYLQEEIADKVITMICGAMAELKINDPIELSTDIGPVIDHKAYASLQQHKENMQKSARLLFVSPVDEHLKQKNYFAPCAFEIKKIAELPGEVFGPILHIIRYKAADLGQIIDEVNATGFGLTLGIHSRINETAEFIKQRVKVGNIYINRNMIGAVVGVQPFGGEGLSGTGPKAGGPYYLPRLMVERVVSNNTAALGGNASLFALEE